MRITGFVGSPRITGNTSILVNRILNSSKEAGAVTEVFNLSELNIKGCKGCYVCKKQSKCAIQDDMQKLYHIIDLSDALIIGSPIYMWQMSSQTKTFIDRLFAYYDMESYPKLLGKKVVLTFVYGDNNNITFNEYINSTTQLMSFIFGANNVETIISSGNKSSDSVLQDNEIIKKAEEIGKNLLSKII